MGVANPPNSLKPILRLAFENDLLKTPLAQWIRYADARIDTSHDYDSEKAKACLALVPRFIEDAIWPLPDDDWCSMDAVNQAIDITPEERKTVLELLEQHLPGTPVWIYGSRIAGTSSPKSDLDLVVFARSSQQAHVGDLREAFEESSLPFRVDLFVWDRLPAAFRHRIEMNYVVLQ